MWALVIQDQTHACTVSTLPVELATRLEIRVLTTTDGNAVHHYVLEVIGARIGNIRKKSCLGHYWLTLSFQSLRLLQRDHCPPNSSEQPWEGKQNLQVVKATKNLLISDPDIFFSLASFSAKSNTTYHNPNCSEMIFEIPCNFQFF